MTKHDVPQRQEPEDPTNASRISDDFDIPELPGEDEEVRLKAQVIEDEFPYDTAFNIGFVGIGQAGSRIAETFYKLGYRRVVVIDGAHQDLEDVDERIPKLDLGTSGARKDISYGAASVQDKDEEIWDLLAKGIGGDADYILCCASLGGGTGSGAIAKVVDVSRKFLEHHGRPPRAGAIVALPMDGEGQRYARNSLATFGALRSLNCSPMIIIDNQRIQDLFRVGVTKIYDKCNEQIARLFHLFNQLAAQRSRFITFDRSELASLLDDGIVTFGASAIKKFDGPTDVSDAIRTQLSQTTLARVEPKTASNAGCIFVGAEAVLDSVPMDFLSGGFDMLVRNIREGGVVHRGVYKGSSTDLRCFTLLSGLDPPAERLQELGQAARIPSSKLAEFLGVDDG